MAYVSTSIVRMPDLNKCLYCGKTDCTLTEEHIVPYSLGGRMVIGRASCESCQKIINEQFENPLMSKSFRMYRDLFGYRSRKRRSRSSDTYTIQVGSGNHFRSIKIPSSEAVRVIIVPNFSHKPPLLAPEIPLSSRFCGFWHRYDEQAVAALQKKYASNPGEHIRFPQMDVHPFLRLLAKIAHGYTFGQADWRDQLEPILPNFILGSSHDWTPFFGINPTPFGNLARDRTFFIAPELYELKDGSRYIAININIFGEAGTPHYLVVSGKEKIGHRINITI